MSAHTSARWSKRRARLMKVRFLRRTSEASALRVCATSCNVEHEPHDIQAEAYVRLTDGVGIQAVLTIPPPLGLNAIGIVDGWYKCGVSQLSLENSVLLTVEESILSKKWM